jgi:hypothetical protein
MSENENEFTHTDGVVYVAVDNVWCTGCAFEFDVCELGVNPCSIGDRKDKRNIIWQPKAEQ